MAAMLGWGAAYVPSAWLVEDGPPLSAAGARLALAGLAVVGGVFAWSVGTVTAARGVRGRGDPLALAGWQMTAGGLALASAGLASTAPTCPSARARPRCRPGSSLVPVVGVVTAWPLLGETPTVRLAVGMAAVCAGSGWWWPRVAGCRVGW